MLFFNFLLIKESKKKVTQVPKNIKQHNSFTVNQHIRSATLILIQHFRMISEGSCGTEDWSNDAENTALLHRNKLYFKI